VVALREVLFDGAGQEGERSTTGARQAVDSVVRQSETIYCETRVCEDAAPVRGLLRRVRALLGAPRRHVESVQGVRYRPGDFFARHIDTDAGDELSPAGPRVWTLFIYLSSAVAGGETYFAEANVTVAPIAGRAVPHFPQTKNN